MSFQLNSVVSTALLPLVHEHVRCIFNLFHTNISLAHQDERKSIILLMADSKEDLEDAKNYVETLCMEPAGGGPGPEDKLEHCISLSPNMYETLSRRRSDIAAASPAHIIWDKEKHSILLLGNSEGVRQTGLLLSQHAEASVRGQSRKLVGRSFTRNTHMARDIADEKNLLLTSQLPPELSISSPGLSTTDGSSLWNVSNSSCYSQFSGLPDVSLNHSPLCRAASDSVTRLGQREKAATFNESRRKLESEDSSYDSDHEQVTATRSLDHQPHPLYRSLSKSHDDISRTTSETLAQEFAEYVSVRHNLVAPVYSSLGSRRHASGPDGSTLFSDNSISSDWQNHMNNDNLCVKQGSESREPSPVHSDKLESVQESPSDCNVDLQQDPQYNSKVEFALKLGYTESLTQRALSKLGMKAGQNELLDELIRLQQCKIEDPQEVLIKETQELLASTIPVSSEGGSVSQSTKAPKQTQKVSESQHLRPIVVDGSNLAMSHGNKETFSCRGIKLCVSWFQARGHKDITVFVPKWRKESSKPDTPIKDQQMLLELEKERLLFFTPSRQVRGRRLVCHDDRYILNLAAETGAIVVSNDNYRELIMDKPEFKKVIEERILMYSFVNDRFMPPDDPLGRNGPCLENFLRLKTSGDTAPPCPYGKKCTYGNKCKFYHAERGNAPHKSVTERLKEQSTKQIMEVRTRTHSRDSSPGEQLSRAKSMNLPMQLHRTESDITVFSRAKQPLSRTRSSQPKVSLPSEGLYHSDSHHYHSPSIVEPIYHSPPMSKPEVSKSKSMECGGSRLRVDLRMSSVPIHADDDQGWGLEHGVSQGCLARFGMTAPPPSSAMTAPPPAATWPAPHFSMAPPPNVPPTVAPPTHEGNHHKRLERQLTINPSYDPRINKDCSKLSPSRGGNQQQQPAILSSAAIAFHRNHPPPPLGMTTPVEPDQSHANVTRIASAPDSIGRWGAAPPSLPSAVVDPAPPPSAAPSRSPMQRHNSTSDTQLHRALSSGTFSVASDTWKFSKFESGMSPILGTTTQTSNIWGAPAASPPRVETPPPTPSHANLGPVGSRPQQGGSDSRTKLFYHLTAIFPEEHVLQVMSLMPNETNAQKLCAAIMKMYPTN